MDIMLLENLLALREKTRFFEDNFSSASLEDVKSQLDIMQELLNNIRYEAIRAAGGYDCEFCGLKGGH